VNESSESLIRRVLLAFGRFTFERENLNRAVSCGVEEVIANGNYEAH